MGAYYFPNNDYDYEGLKKKLKVKKGEGIAAVMAPHFKLKEEFHDLLKPAFIHDMREKESRIQKQNDAETYIQNIIHNLSFGMRLPDLYEEEESTVKVCFDSVKKGIIDIHDVLETSSNAIEHAALQHSFNVLGRYLIKYRLSNAIKSEVLTPTTRLTFVNCLIDFFENFYDDTYVHDHLHSVNFVKDMAGDFTSIMKEMKKIAPHMDRKNAIYLANTYHRLSSPFMYMVSHKGFDVMNGKDFKRYMHDMFIHLKTISKSLKKMNHYQK